MVKKCFKIHEGKSQGAALITQNANPLEPSGSSMSPRSVETGGIPVSEEIYLRVQCARCAEVC